MSLDAQKAARYGAQILCAIHDSSRLARLAVPLNFEAWVASKPEEPKKQPRMRRASRAKRCRRIIYLVHDVLDYCRLPNKSIHLLVSWEPTGKRCYRPSWIPRTDLLGAHFDQKIVEMLADQPPCSLGTASMPAAMRSLLASK